MQNILKWYMGSGKVSQTALDDNDDENVNIKIVRYR